MGEACIAVLPAVQLPFLLIDHGVRDATTASILIAASSAVAVAIGGAYPILRRHLSVDGVLAMMLGAAAIAYLGLSVATGTITLGLALLVVGLPVGLMIPHFSAVAIERASESARGRAVGLVTGSICFGQLMIPFVSEPLRAAIGTQRMFAAIALVLLVGGVAAALAPRLGQGRTRAVR
jgi:MFS family permease